MAGKSALPASPSYQQGPPAISYGPGEAPAQAPMPQMPAPRPQMPMMGPARAPMQLNYMPGMQGGGSRGPMAFAQPMTFNQSMNARTLAPFMPPPVARGGGQMVPGARPPARTAPVSGKNANPAPPQAVQRPAPQPVPQPTAPQPTAPPLRPQIGVPTYNQKMATMMRGMVM